MVRPRRYGREPRYRGRRAVWIGAAIVVAVAVLLAMAALWNLLANAPAAASPRPEAPATRPPLVGAVATVAALATSMVSPVGTPQPTRSVVATLIPTAAPEAERPPNETTPLAAEPAASTGAPRVLL